MPRKPQFSPTKIGLYLACPHKYYWTYLDARGKRYQRAQSYFSFGTSLHRALERFHDSGDQGVTNVREAVVALEENWIDAGYRSAREAEEALGTGRELLARAVEDHIEHADGSETLFVERTLRTDLGDFWLLGRIDRLDEKPDGTLEIVDYKTGRSSVSDEDVENDLAMAIYQFLVRKNYGERPVVATILALRTGERASARLTEEGFEALEEDVRSICTEIANTNWEERRPKRKELCDACDFYPLCSKDPGYDEP